MTEKVEIDMNTELTEKTAELAACINTLAVHHPEKYHRQLLTLQDQLAKLELLIIVKELNAEHEAYQSAIAGINHAIDFIGEAEKKIKKINEAIYGIAQAINSIERALADAVI
jgi:inorganic triphosphatase YgiF